jgi:transposase
MSPPRDHAPFLLALVTEQPDLTLNEIVAALAQVGIVGSRTAMCRFYDQHGLTFKKTLCVAEQKTRRGSSRTPTSDSRARLV